MSLLTESTENDHYVVLGVRRCATPAQITSAYRKQALKCHPDKNPNDPSSVESFHKLSLALDVLSDPATRSAFDRILDVRVADSLRDKKINDDLWRFREDFNTGAASANEQLRRGAADQQRRGDAERLKYEQDRRRFKEKLEAKEKAAFHAAALRKQAAEELKREKEKLRQAGLQFQAEQERLSRGLRNISISPVEIELDISRILHLKWRSKKTDPKLVNYSPDLIRDLFSKYGQVSEVVVSPKKKGRAIVEFATEPAALNALQRERGLASNPLSVSLISRSLNVNNTPSNSTSERTASQIDGDVIKDFDNLKI